MAESETGWTKEWPAIGGVYWYRLDAKALSDIVEVRDGDVYYAGDEVGVSVRNHEGCEWLGPISPSDAEQLVELRKLAQTSLDLLTDIYRSHASQRFSAVRLSPICAHVRELQTLLNTKKSDRCPHGIYRRLVKCALCDQFEVKH